MFVRVRSFMSVRVRFFMFIFQKVFSVLLIFYFPHMYYFPLFLFTFPTFLDFLV
ncbi:hypothetical protein Hanom_Chr12g01072501 [Helianthus anomalus]